MHKETKYWVTFWTPGIIVGESRTRELENLDPHNVEWPNNVYAFTLHEREDLIEGEKRYMGEPRQVGPMYYHPDSKIETLKQVEKNPNKGDCLVQNMKCNHWNRIIWTRWGNWPQPYDKKKIIILKENS